MKEKTNLDNRLNQFVIKKHLLSKTIFVIISEFFHRINKFNIIDCKLKKSNYDFNFFKPMTFLTNITILNLKPKKKLNNMTYKEWLQSVFNKITKYVYVCPVVIECDLIKSKIKISSHIQCKYCKQLIEKERYYEDHLKIMCPEVAVSCPLCLGKVKRKSMTYHWSNNCKQYYIQCFLCPKVFNVKTKHQINQHVLRHSMDLDEESGKYELVFMDNKQAVELSNEYPIYTITICTKCTTRGIAPVVPPKYRYKLIPTECDNCYDRKNNKNDAIPQKTKTARISSMKKKRGNKVLPHPFPKNVKLKSVKTNNKK